MQSFFPPQFNQQMDSVRSLDSTSSFDITLDMKKQYAVKAIRKNNRKFKKPNGKPKRPLSAYNIFFKHEREKLVKAKQKVGFANMAKLISVKWKEVDTEGRKEFAAAADIEQKKYRAAVKEWKVSHKAEMEVQMRNAQQQSHQFAGASPLLAQTNPHMLQRLMIEQQMMEQHKMMQAQMQNEAHGRRMSMPNMGTCAVTSAPTFSNETLQQLLQQQHQQQQQQQQQQQYQQQQHQQQHQQQQHQQSQAIIGRRFSMPLQSISAPQLQSVPSATFEVALQDSFTTDLTHSSYDSSDESTLDDETADMLINMPIFDDLGEQQVQQQRQQLPNAISSVAAITPRRSSMPMLHTKNKLVDLTTTLTPLVGGAKTSRRLSMPQISDEMKEMQDILAMLDEEIPAICSATNSAA
mmetsp:Transcript_25966/g.43322  ORF Transcript_25966/g.43322 Transcript_25966/m.43322 type:complete len:408 (+) Transcript_25966:105-1328(+)|eukprot:CAMPEP_0119012038 /NCGR_PEP_ID=MMETSP1176-20130426/6040_1 /TAXON_ID=265551 /ORGANISM="Synedropsis recta cf, Strain CCMP1620" /LENGTH=407 /DNA_ID=CAMNT_0006964937 /DNA_START=94 /DNA_END=1313 /DNA_ORIENTATION=-